MAGLRLVGGSTADLPKHSVSVSSVVIDAENRGRAGGWNCPYCTPQMTASHAPVSRSRCRCQAVGRLNSPLVMPAVEVLGEGFEDLSNGGRVGGG